MATSEIVRRAVEEVRRVCAEPPSAQRQESRARHCVTRFGQPHARLFPLLGRKVRTPGGVGILWRCFAEQSAVLLDRDAQKIATYFPTGQIEPVSIDP